MYLKNILYPREKPSHEATVALSQNMTSQESLELLRNCFRPNALSNSLMDCKVMAKQQGSFVDHCRYLDYEYFDGAPDRRYWCDRLEAEPCMTIKAVTTVPLRNQSMYSMAYLMDNFIRGDIICPLILAYQKRFSGVPCALWPIDSAELERTAGVWKRNRRDPMFERWQAILMQSRVTEVKKHPEGGYLHAVVEVWIDVYKAFAMPAGADSFKLPPNFFERRLHPEEFVHTSKAAGKQPAVSDMEYDDETDDDEELIDIMGDQESVMSRARRIRQ